MKNVLNCSGHEILVKNCTFSNGVYIYDEYNKKYMDLESGVWCTSIGHNNKGVNEVINKFTSTIMHTGFCYSNSVVQKAAEQILKVTNNQEGKCAFLNSGSEAVNFSRILSRHINPGGNTLILHDAYLGASFTQETDNNWIHFDWSKCNNCLKNELCNDDCPNIKEIPNNISEFIFEPGSSSGAVRFPPVSLINKIVNKVRKNNGKIIINEVTTGIGRTGKWFGYNHYDLKPDFIAIGKGIGNGYPVSTIVIEKKTAKELENNEIKYYQSHMNDPLGAAIVQEVILQIEKNNLIENSYNIGKYIESELEKIVDNKIITEVRCRGLMIAIDIANEEKCNYIYKKLLNEGFIVCNRKTMLRIDPPLIISKKHISHFLNVLNDIIKQIH